MVNIVPSKVGLPLQKGKIEFFRHEEYVGILMGNGEGFEDGNGAVDGEVVDTLEATGRDLVNEEMIGLCFDEPVHTTIGVG